jgi:hypothetical protein
MITRLWWPLKEPYALAKANEKAEAIIEAEK